MGGAAYPPPLCHFQYNLLVVVLGPVVVHMFQEVELPVVHSDVAAVVVVAAVVAV